MSNSKPSIIALPNSDFQLEWERVCQSAPFKLIDRPVLEIVGADERYTLETGVNLLLQSPLEFLVGAFHSARAEDGRPYLVLELEVQDFAADQIRGYFKLQTKADLGLRFPWHMVVADQYVASKSYRYFAAALSNSFHGRVVSFDKLVLGYQNQGLEDNTPFSVNETAPSDY